MTATHNYINRDRNHWMLPLAVVTALATLVFWFPMSALWHQQSEINATAAQITAIKQQDQALKLQAKSVSSKAAAMLLARSQYQLVAPGQSLIPELFLKSQQLIVLRHALRTCRRATLYLSGVGCDGKIRDCHILGFTRSVRNYGAVLV